MTTEIKEESAEVFTTTRSTRRSVARREREDSFSSGGMSLDVLAQVATETLEKEPVPQKKSSSVSTSSSYIYTWSLMQRFYLNEMPGALLE